MGVPFSTCPLNYIPEGVNNQLILFQAHYLEKVGKSPISINITECGSPCLFENFVKFTGKFVPHDWENECSM